jgi:hypothetical protein
MAQKSARLWQFLNQYKIKILTISGILGVFDVKPYLKGSAFSELKNASYFNLVRPTHRGISWPHEQDLSSDTIVYDIQNT